MANGPVHDARDRVWSISGPAQMLTKLGWEMTMIFNTLKSRDVRVTTYFAMNACISAWHMVDWLIASLDTEGRWADAQRALGASNKRELYAVIDDQPAMRACQQVANAAKHVLLEEGRSYKPGYEVSIGAHHAPDGSMHSLRIETPDGNHEVQWMLYTVYEWWAANLEKMGYQVTRDAPLSLG